MKMGTRSLLYGTHQFAIHPLMVALAWHRLYGFPRDPRLWVAFVVHDWGYWGKPDMDGPEGQLHPQLGARLMYRWFGRDWHDLCLGHSRYYAERVGIPISPLMRADKMATVLIPFWLYCALARLSGEWREYLAFHRAAGYEVRTLTEWARNLRALWRSRYDR